RHRPITSGQSPTPPSLRFLYLLRPPPRAPLFPYTTLFRSGGGRAPRGRHRREPLLHGDQRARPERVGHRALRARRARHPRRAPRSEEHTSELQSLRHLVCRLLLEKKKQGTVRTASALPTTL